MPQPPQKLPASDMPDSVTFQKWSGLRNTVTSERLAPDELETAKNVDLDDAGQIHRRRGYTRVSTGEFHSLFAAASGTIYGVKNGTLGIIYPNYSFSGLQSEMGADPVSYTQVGQKLYFASATNSGKIDTVSNMVEPWGAAVSAGVWISPVVNPTATINPIRGRLLGKPPLATDIAYWHSRIYLANKNTLWATEVYLYDYVDKTKNFKTFEADITALGAVQDGIYVGTENAMWFLSGAFDKMSSVSVVNSGVLPGSMVPVSSELVDPQVPLDQNALVTSDALLFMTTSGLCVGFSSGKCFNLTQNTILFPNAVTAAAMFRRQDGQNSYVGVLDSRGDPTTSARIGDYVSAEIVRGNGA